MQRAASGLNKIMGEVLRRAPREEAVQLAWSMICGAKVAARTQPLEFAGSVLRVQVPDAAWRSQLSELEGRYISEFEQVLGSKLVEHVEFVVEK